ncbi:MAG: amidophosphoribosyltransferase [Thermoplasmata archaeon]|nr:MAG: amidophosphoribosyltransferase [Thermoplasmata archaeon]
MRRSASRLRGGEERRPPKNSGGSRLRGDIEGVEVSGETEEACGICAASCPRGNALFEVYKMSKELQHRGQSGAGYTSFNPRRKMILTTHKGLGLVNEVYQVSNTESFGQLMEIHAGPRAIGHNRYGTSGVVSQQHVQPFERRHGKLWKWFSFGFNGHITNREELERSLKRDGYHLMYDTDTEVMMHFISKYLEEVKDRDMKDVFRNLSQDFDGAYNIVYINGEGTTVVVRDPYGFKPLSYTVAEGGTYSASESNALNYYNIEGIEDLSPGEMAFLENEEVRVERYAPQRRKSFCYFEFLYFAHVSSRLEGRSVYQVRKRVGEELARMEFLNINEKEWVIIPVPNTARPIANAYAKALGLPEIYEEGLIETTKGRTFIEESSRHLKVMTKFHPLRSVLKGKKVVVIDDSIVRSTTMKTIVNYHLKKLGGAKEVHVRIGTPPIIAPCYYGIDMKTFSELFAAPYQDRISEGVPEEGVAEEMARRLGADSLMYQSMEGLIRAIGMPRSELCTACLTREYPTPWGRRTDERAYREYLTKSAKG